MRPLQVILCCAIIPKRELTGNRVGRANQKIYVKPLNESGVLSLSKGRIYHYFVMNENQPERIYISLGTNLGNRELNLEAVKGDLPPQVKILNCSPVYQTEPWGYLDQPDFLNQVLAVETSLSPRELLEYIKGIEKKIGREPSFRFGPRIVDYSFLWGSDHTGRGPGYPSSSHKGSGFCVDPTGKYRS